MRIVHSINLLAVLASLTLNGLAHAGLPSTDHGRPKNQVKANRVTKFVAGQPICQASLNETPQLAPQFVKLSPETSISDGGPFGNLPRCQGEDLADISEMADLANAGNRVALLPLMAVPIVVCSASVALGAFTGYAIADMLSPDVGPMIYSSMGLAGSASALTMLRTEALKLPMNYAAAYGGLIGASCSLVGSLAGYVYYVAKHDN